MLLLRQKDFIDWAAQGLNEEGLNRLAEVRHKRAIALNKLRNSGADQAKLGEALTKTNLGIKKATEGLTNKYKGNATVPSVKFNDNIFHNNGIKNNQQKKSIASSNSTKPTNTKLGNGGNFINSTNGGGNKNLTGGTKSVNMKPTTPTSGTPVSKVGKNFFKDTWKSGKAGKAGLIGAGLGLATGIGYLGSKLSNNN